MGVVTPTPVSPRPFLPPSPQPSPTRGEGVARISSPLMGED